MSDVSSYSDSHLLFLIKEGDEAAFSILFERHRGKLYYYLLRHVKSAEIAEEIVIDVFLKLWNGRELADQIIEPSAFFHKVAYYKALDFLRTASRSKRLLQVYVDRAEEYQQQTPADLLIDGELRELLLKAINQLAPRQKHIYELSRVEGLSHEQIAEQLHLSRSTINNTIMAATRSISLFLKKQAQGKAALSLLFGLFQAF